MAKRVSMVLPDGFDPGLLNEMQEKYGVKFLDVEDLSVPEGSSPKLVEESESSETSIWEPDSPFLELPSHILANIANRLDARSFVALAFSSYKLYHFYRQPSTLNKVEVPLQWDELYVFDDGSLTCESVLVPSRLHEEKALECFDSLNHWPFSVRIQELHFEGNALRMAREILSRMKAKSVYMIEMFNRIAEYRDLLDLIEDYEVKSAEWAEFDDYSEEDLHDLLHKPLERLSIRNADSISLHDVVIPELSIFETSVDPAALIVIIEKFVTTDALVDWKLNSGNISLRDFMSCLSEYQLLHIDYTGPVPPQRPLAFISNGDNNSHLIYYILRADGKIVSISNAFDIVFIRIKFIPLAEAPAIFARV